MTKHFKRIVAMLLCVLMTASTAVFATEDKKEGGTGDETVSSGAVRYDPESDFPVYSGYTPDYSGYTSDEYEFFLEILQLYTDTHLYEFTTDQAMEAFVMKLMQENPDLFKFFVNTLLGTMDEYSSYYEYGTGIASDGSTSAYGIMYAKQDDGIYITEVVKNSPAQYAGLMAGDKLVAVEGIPVEGLTLEGAGYLLKYLPYVPEEVFDENGVSLGIPNEPEFILNEETGKKIYPLHIDVSRNGQTVSAKMVKGRVVTSDISYSKADHNKYSYISIAAFTKDEVYDDFKAALDLAKSANNGNLIIDVRDNGGGRIEDAVNMACLLIPEKGRLLYHINSREHLQPEPVYSEGNDYGYTFDKIIVLVNENTASAAELFTNILRYNCGATIVGKTTYGKAVGQQSYLLNNGDVFTITSLEILDHLKRSYHNIGIVPDVEIDLTIKKEEYTAPEKALSAENIPELVPGAQNDAVYALQERLVICGYMLPEYVSGTYDSVTQAAVKAWQVYHYGNPDTPITEKMLQTVELVVERSEHRYYYYDAQLEVAEFTLSSRSQGKRRAKELEKESNEVWADYYAWQEAEQEKINQEIAAENEQESGQDEEAANTDSTEGTDDSGAENTEGENT